jgi:hypothetical protein
MLLSSSMPVGMVVSKGSKEQLRTVAAADIPNTAAAAATEVSAVGLAAAAALIPNKAMRSRSASNSSSTTPRGGLVGPAAQLGGAATRPAAAPVAVPLTAALLSPRCLFTGAGEQQ